MRKIIYLCLILICSISACNKETQTIPKGIYYPQVKTIIAQHCTNSCHSPAQGRPQGMPVILDTDSDIVQRAAGIKAAVADPASPMNKRMPQNDSLNAADINTIVQWYAKGGRTMD